MKKILMIVMNDFINDARVIKEATTLGKNGYEVQVLSLHKEGSKVDEVFEYFKVKRLELRTRKAMKSKNRFIQLFKYAEFVNKVLEFAITYEPDIVHCHDLDTVYIGKKIKKRTKCKLIYDSHELWMGTRLVEQSPWFIRKILNSLERSGIKDASAIITCSESAVNYLKAEYSVDKVHLLRNVPYYFERKPSKNVDLKVELGIDKSDFLIIHQGAIMTGRGLDVIIEAISKLDKSVKLLILGNGSYKKKLIDKVNYLNLNDQVLFLDAVPYNDLMYYTAGADLGITLIENVCKSYYFSLPNKLFEYIQAGIPIICSNFPDMESIVLNNDLGTSVDPTDVNQLIEHILELKKKDDNYYTKVDSLKQISNILNWEKEQTILIDLYKKL